MSSREEEDEGGSWRVGGLEVGRLEGLRVGEFDSWRVGDRSRAREFKRAQRPSRLMERRAFGRKS
jgi:hypothetical protein